MDLSLLKSRMQELGIHPNKKLGQNFLIGDAIIKQIVDSVAKLKPVHLIEVGPGLGALTNNLQQLGVKLELVELDKKIANYWQSQGLVVHHVDALSWNWSGHTSAETVLVSNLPYQISSSLVIAISEIDTVCSMVLMFQKEVAQRILGQPRQKDYGLLSVMAQTYWDINRVCDVSPGNFYPSPKVQSRVLKFVRNATPNSPAPKEAFLKFLKVCFANRRKMLLPKLAYWSGRPVDDICALMVQIGYNAKVRAEEVSVNHFAILFGELRVRN